MSLLNGAALRLRGFLRTRSALTHPIGCRANASTRSKTSASRKAQPARPSLAQRSQTPPSRIRPADQQEAAQPRRKTPNINPEDHQEPTRYGPKAPAYPSHLLIYSASRSKIVFIAWLKSLTVFCAVGCSAIIAPLVYGDPQSNGWLGAISSTFVSLNPITVCGFIPLFFTAFAYAPFVARVFLGVAAPSARVNKDTLMRYTENLKKDAPLQIVTIRWYGAAKTTTLKLGELRAIRPRWWGSFANLRRENVDASGRIIKDRLEKGASPWRRLVARLDEPRNKFFIDMSNERGSKNSDAPGVWANVWRQIQKQSGDVIS
ncbi:hypothetical protein NA57DRAFT_71936 [Rhizodiscina lignyota]|uniref:Uncharacterized protein n=1 Tax=Rhizodiscina lignyota TaxID=1504668 RepID=A0A9P4IN99_9PEZI|nr:hypothetical protein NA57DRAFT_71936 [Rhizodiscina lignyota]